MAVGNVKASPRLARYSNDIEDAIDTLTPSIVKLLPDKYKYISRWIALKLMDNDPKILNSIKKHLSIELFSEEIIDKLFTISSVISNIANFRNTLVSSIIQKAEDINKKVCILRDKNYNIRDRKIDKILTSKKFGIPIMLLFLCLIFWITIVGANYPSQMLSHLFGILEEKLIWIFNYLHSPLWLKSLLIDGVYQTLAWVIAVMLPPMAIFFPLFTFLEDLGYLPRIAFNLDKCFKKCCTSGKQALTMCMGFGCNAAGVVGCRIIDSPRERLIAILTNNFVPCNRKIPFFNNNGYNFYWNFLFKFFFIFCINCFCFIINFIRYFSYTFNI